MSEPPREIGRAALDLLRDGDSQTQRDFLAFAVAEALDVTPSQVMIDLWVDRAGSTTLEIGVDRS